MEAYVNNAGLVLLAPYLPRFFTMTEVVESNVFPSEIQQQRAALLLQYACAGSTDFREEDLLLNKLLCGMAYDSTLGYPIEVKEEEEEITGQMLEAIISHWDLVKNSSREGFRESWLWREGKLIPNEASWELAVGQKAYDVLLDYLPFTLSPVKLPWMKMPINVQWR